MTLSPPSTSDRMMPHAGDAPVRGGVAAASAMAHVAALAVLMSLAVKLPPAPADLPAIPVFFRPAAQAPAAVPRPVAALTAAEPARVVPAAPVVQPAPTAAVAAPFAIRRPAFRTAQVRPRQASPPRPTGLINAPPRVLPSAPAAAPAAAVADDGAALLQFAGDIQAVVRDAAKMPAAAVRQHREGRAQVRFAYLDGRVNGVVVVQSSRSRLLDDAALSAVRQAHYPLPPPQLRGRVLPLLVWIDFRVQAASPG